MVGTTLLLLVMNLSSWGTDILAFCAVLMSINSISVCQNMKNVTHPFHTLTSLCIFAIVSLDISLFSEQENLLSNHKFLQLLVIFLILLTSMFASGVILLGEIGCQSLSGVREITYVPLNMKRKEAGQSKNMTEKRRVPINFSPNEHFNLHIKFIIFLTVNHTILKMLVHRIQYWMN